VKFTSETVECKRAKRAWVHTSERTTVSYKRAKRAWSISYTLLIFFVSTDCSGTEGIRPVTNFVPLLAPYRVFFQGNKPY